jgi:FkbM family methyltransferase
MRKKINLSLFIKIILYSRYLPAIIFKIKNWPDFVLNYVGIKNSGAVYEFRNGLKIETGDGVSAATIAVIFIKKDYGEVPGNYTIIDIGANIGAYSIFACKPENTIVYAFEPVPSNYDLLLKNIRYNNLEKRILPFNLAVGAKQEKRKIYLGGSPFHSFHPIDNSASPDYADVDCVSLKDIFDSNKIEKCDILKMDCEGAEFEILYNLPENYYKRIKEIRAEYHSNLAIGKNNAEDLMNFLEQKGFKIKRIKKVDFNNGDFWAEKI